LLYRDCAKRLVAFFDPRRLPETISEDDAVGYRNAMQARPESAGGPLRNASIKGDLVYLKQVLLYAYQNRRSTGMAEIQLLTLPRIKRQKSLVHALGAEELAAIAKARLQRDKERTVTICLIAAVTGLRKWPLLHFERGWFDAKAQAIRVPGWAMKGGENRWGDEEFEVPVCAWAAELLGQSAERSRSKWLFPNRRTGRPNGQLDRSLVRIAAAASIPAFSLKCLRNTFASLLANAGVHEQVIGVLMGHAASTVTRDYIKRQPNALREAVAKLDELRSKIAAQPENVARFRRA
jgi:integrase